MHKLNMQTQIYFIEISQSVSQKGEVPHLKVKMLEITEQLNGTLQNICSLIYFPARRVC